jgi:hypothetical protein
MVLRWMWIIFALLLVGVVLTGNGHLLFEEGL